MDNGLIEDFRKYIKPFMAKKLEEINYEGKGLLDNYEFQKDFDELLNLAKLGLTVKEGKWQEDFFGNPICNKCKNLALFDYDGQTGCKSKYCPNCGAKMKQG